MKRLRHLLLAAAVVLSAGLMTAPALVSADFKGDACSGINSLNSTTGASDSCDSAAADASVNNIIRTVINVLSWLVGIAAVIMIIFNGFRFITAAGDSSGVAAARTGIIYALIGIVVAVLAQVLVHFVISQTATATTTCTTAGQKNCTVKR